MVLFICTDFLHNYHCRIFILKFPLLVNISSSYGYIMLTMQSFYSTVLIYHLACPFFHCYIFCKFPRLQALSAGGGGFALGWGEISFLAISPIPISLLAISHFLVSIYCFIKI